ncbi:aminopeptidase N [Shewanella sp. CG12_big_fil_rev_8_21_14_0_65_47_15]|uniref:aminopeptidase N n=1 Tax=Shewanella sp. CG12_big_fil_rev_8_21_14_0_65_47_15 TaxID=1975537 RepID=UPI000CAA5B0B|nr:aminopeptidase N [Shewanella sp. CG12_big_fil_rev_8_21_14_0_65_47_15]PIW62872.1 MAG: aminopeptidase N [Shewanella sp. CG12_big_fil_rev_8_21_14_0_65_47_15]
MTQAQAKYLKDYQAPHFTIETIALAFDLAGKDTRVKAVSQIKRTSSHTLPLVLDGDDLILLAVSINGETVPYQVSQGQLQLETSLDEFELTIETQLDPEANSSLEGLYMSDGAYCTQCEAEGFRRITYFLDRPDVLAKYTVRIEADRAAFPYLLSNGNLIERGELPEGRHYVCWQDPFPKPAYLFALVAGNFDLLEDEFITRSDRKVLLQVFVDKGNLHKATHAMASLKKSMAWDESRFDLEYDLDIYMIVAVDFFNMGAMENKGLNIFNTKYVLADTLTATDEDYHGIESVVGHEYFHNWTGNRVTCRDWFQLSLKEGLTVFRDQEFSSDLGSRAVNRIHAIKVIKNQQFAEDSGPMSHPIRPESVIEMNNFYTVTVYNKGAEVIRMMHTLLGEAKFLAGMKLYFKRHDGQAVTCDDFVAAMEDASGVDLTQFRLWYSQAGTPAVTATDSFDAKTGVYQLTLKQSLANSASPLHIPFSIELLDAKGHSLVNQVLDFTQAEQVFSFEGLTHKPVISLLQDFSAPVKLHYDFEVDQLVHLMRFATSEVARWEASVVLVSQAIWLNVAHLQQQQTMTLDERVRDSFKGMLLDTELDPALIAEILAIPTASALIEQAESVDLDALALAREFVLTELASYCEDELTALYRMLVTVDSTQARALKNQCLNWLSRVSAEAEDVVVTQFEQASNMTDSLGALMAANVGDLPCRHDLMLAFEQRWHDTPLVMDKWFMLQATRDADDVIDTLRQLQQHGSFSMSNPNRVRALIGSFAAGNIYQFHRADGKGYAFLTECLITLNKLNPQVAARMVTPLIQFGKFDKARQSQIRACLGQLLALPELSKDMYEKVSKALTN